MMTTHSLLLLANKLRLLPQGEGLRRQRRVPFTQAARAQIRVPLVVLTSGDAWVPSVGLR